MNAAAVSAAQTEVLTDAAALPADWDALMAGVSPYLGRAYLQALAAAPPPGTRYVFAAVRQGEALVAGAIFTLPAFVITGAWDDIEYFPSTVIMVIGGVLGVLFVIILRRTLVVESDLVFAQVDAQLTDARSELERILRRALDFDWDL